MYFVITCGIQRLNKNTCTCYRVVHVVVPYVGKYLDLFQTDKATLETRVTVFNVTEATTCFMWVVVAPKHY